MSTLDNPPERGSTRIGDGPGGPAAAAGHDTAHDGLHDVPWEATQASPEFQSLKRALRRFAFPATAAFLAWYLLYVLLSGYARGFMDTKVFGNVNVAYLFGLLQFVSTFVIAYVYSRYAEKNLDPTADAIRERLERGAR